MKTEEEQKNKQSNFSAANFFMFWLKLFRLPGKILLPLWAFSKAGKSTKGGISAHMMLNNSFLKTFGEIVFSSIFWLFISIWMISIFSSSNSSKKTSSLASVSSSEKNVTPEISVSKTETVNNLTTKGANATKHPLPDSDTRHNIQPSFDCSQARHNSEMLVCQNSDLAALDRQLFALYQSSDTPDKKTEQITWIREKNRCTDKACVKAAYERRIKQLERFENTKVPNKTLKRPEHFSENPLQGIYD